MYAQRKKNMPIKRVKSGGGWPAIRYTLRKSREVGGLWKMYRALRTKNACKTCALGMGGQTGRHGQRSGPFSGSLQEVDAGHGRRHAGGDPARVLVGPIRSSSCRSSRRVSWNPAAGWCSRCCLNEANQHYRPIAWDDALPRVAAKLKATPADETFWYFSGRSSQRSRLSAAACSPAFTAPTTSTTAATIATRPAASG